jgi:hypothetical protein
MCCHTRLPSPAGPPSGAGLLCLSTWDARPATSQSRGETFVALLLARVTGRLHRDHDRYALEKRSSRRPTTACLLPTESASRPTRRSRSARPSASLKPHRWPPRLAREPLGRRAPAARPRADQGAWGLQRVPISPCCSRSEPFVASQSQKLEDAANGVFGRSSDLRAFHCAAPALRHQAGGRSG